MIKFEKIVNEMKFGGNWSYNFNEFQNKATENRGGASFVVGVEDPKIGFSKNNENYHI